jgi:hypothetical protein
MSVQIAPLNYSAHIWSPASWGDLNGFQGLLGVGAPSRTPKPDFSPARCATHARTHTERAPPVARPKQNGRRCAASGPDAVARLPSRGENNYTHKRVC